MIGTRPVASLPRSLPEPLLPLATLALDLRWTWSHAGDALWRALDAELWERTENPWLMLQLVSADHLEALAGDERFLADLRAQVAERREMLEQPGWFTKTHGSKTAPIAYFSMEFGLHEALPLYAGGLGVLAGDHLKTASDLDVPLVGVGILWQQGYVRQVLDTDGYQQDLYPHNDPSTLPIQPLRTSDGDPLDVALELPGRRIQLRAWYAVVGRTRLYLLDSNHPLNAPTDRGLTSTLYGSDPDTRLMQELILGIGGWRLLHAIGYDAAVCHLNEGHAAFVILERAHQFMQDHGVSFREALWATRAGNVFTTHTAVPAGFDTFGPDLIEKYTPYFDEYVRNLGIAWPDLLALGRRNPDDDQEPFSMAYLALRGSAHVNAVSELHGSVSRRLFQDLFPRWPARDVPIGHITNGVHVPSWDSAEADRLWTAACGKERWREEMEDVGESIAGQRDEDIWSLRTRERAGLVDMTRRRLHQQLAQRGVSGDDLAVAEKVLDPEALTLGFARRFAAYKRPNLLLSDPERLKRLLTDPARPVQIVIAGKAHPSDHQGKQFIAAWVQFAEDPDVRRHVVFIEDYDMTLAADLVQGVDVWLNTPRRPWEACGTSGMKVLVNGGLNLSELDGWWVEAYAAETGWALTNGHDLSESDRDAAEARSLYRLLESEVVPLFYDRDARGLPRGWINRIRSSMADLTPRFSSNRMLREYVENAYLPAASDVHDRSAYGARLARNLAAWDAQVAKAWPEVRVTDVIRRDEDDAVQVTTTIEVGDLAPDHVRVDLVADPIGPLPPVCEPMNREETDDDGPVSYTITLRTDRPAGHFTPRAVPNHPSAHVPLECPRIRWPA